MSNYPNNELTQHEKIFVVMLREYNSTGKFKFWRASEFQHPVHDVFIGYEATARMSELVKLYPWMFKTRRNGRFREVQLAMRYPREIYRALPSDMARHLVREKIIK